MNDKRLDVACFDGLSIWFDDVPPRQLNLPFHVFELFVRLQTHTHTHEIVMCYIFDDNDDDAQTQTQMTPQEWNKTHPGARVKLARDKERKGKGFMKLIWCEQVWNAIDKERERQREREGQDRNVCWCKRRNKPSRYVHITVGKAKQNGTWNATTSASDSNFNGTTNWMQVSFSFCNDRKNASDRSPFHTKWTWKFAGEYVRLDGIQCHCTSVNIANHAPTLNPIDSNSLKIVHEQKSVSYMLPLKCESLANTTFIASFDANALVTLGGALNPAHISVSLFLSLPSRFLCLFAFILYFDVCVIVVITMLDATRFGDRAVSCSLPRIYTYLLYWNAIKFAWMPKLTEAIWK